MNRDYLQSELLTMPGVVVEGLGTQTHTSDGGRKGQGQQKEPDPLRRAL